MFSTPIALLVVYLLVGMVTTAFLWSHLAMEIEMAIGLEEDDTQGPLRFFLTVIFLLTWPLVLYDVVRRS